MFPCGFAQVGSGFRGQGFTRSFVMETAMNQFPDKGWFLKNPVFSGGNFEGVAAAILKMPAPAKKMVPASGPELFRAGFGGSGQRIQEANE